VKNGEAVRAFEQQFAEYVGARYCIALNSGTSTLHTALVALGVKPGDRVAVPPLTMSATTIAVLHAGAVPVFMDVDPDTWLMQMPPENDHMFKAPVSLYGLHTRLPNDAFRLVVDDAAQTLRPHIGGKDGGVGDWWGHFTSYSFQASKILPLGEGGMLATDDEDLAQRAREFSSLGYRMRADQPRIDPAILKRPNYARHHSLGWNYRMNDVTARLGSDMMALESPTSRLIRCRVAAAYYRAAIRGCSWITPQYVPDGWTHDYWCYAVALESADLWTPFTDAVVRHGGEMPYGAWRLTYQEPAFQHLAEDGCCPVAEDLQPRLVQFQTNDGEAALRNADAVARAIREVGG